MFRSLSVASRQGAIRKRSSTHSQLSTRSSGCSDIYARNSDLLLEKHLSLITVSQTSTFDHTLTSADEPPTSSQDVLKDINEDLDRIRMNMKRVLSSSTSSDRDRSSLSSGSNDMLNRSDLCSPNGEICEIICSDSEDDSMIEIRLNKSKDGRNLVEEAGPLPSRSVCVDSGLLMEEEAFCGSEKLNASQQDVSEPDQISGISQPGNKTAAVKSDDEAIISEPDNQMTNSEPGVNATRTERDLVRLRSCHLSATSSEFEECSQIPSDAVRDSGYNEPSLPLDTNFNINRPKPEQIRELSASSEVIGISPLQEDTTTSELKDTNGLEDICDSTELTPFEPMLRSNSVGLKTKLQYLSELYSTEDMEHSDPSPKALNPPYNIFNKSR